MFVGVRWSIWPSTAPFFTKSPTSAPKYKISPEALDLISIDDIASMIPEASIETSNFSGMTSSFYNKLQAFLYLDPTHKILKIYLLKN